MKVAVLIPVLDRPHRARPLFDSLMGSLPARRSRWGTVRVEPWFLLSLGDEAEYAAVEELGLPPVVVPWPATRGDYARKMNYGVRSSDAEWCLFAADDLRFHDGWLEALFDAHAETHACVIGTNDLGNERVYNGRHSTHTLIHRDYLACGTIDEAGIVFHEGYWHNFVDDELVATALYRETWATALDSRIEHLHPHWRKADDDATYRKGQAHFEDDRALFHARAHLWAGTWRSS